MIRGKEKAVGYAVKISYRAKPSNVRQVLKGAYLN